MDSTPSVRPGHRLHRRAGDHEARRSRRPTPAAPAAGSATAYTSTSWPRRRPGGTQPACTGSATCTSSVGLLQRRSAAGAPPPRRRGASVRPSGRDRRGEVPAGGGVQPDVDGDQVVGGEHGAGREVAARRPDRARWRRRLRPPARRGAPSRGRAARRGPDAGPASAAGGPGAAPARCRARPAAGRLRCGRRSPRLTSSAATADGRRPCRCQRTVPLGMQMMEDGCRCARTVVHTFGCGRRATVTGAADRLTRTGRRGPMPTRAS